MPLVNTIVGTDSPQIKDIYVKLKDLNMSLKDYVQSVTKTNITYTIGVNGSFNTDSIYDRNINVKIGVADNFSFEMDKSINVYIGVSELFLNNAGMVITDIFKYNIVIDETNFDEALSPVGFAAFREMKTGDYTYKDAICKIRLEAQNSGDRPNIRQYVHKVDVPDVVESGVITLTSTNQPVIYKFKRKFHTVPEVNFSVKSSDVYGANIIPVNITAEEVSVYLKSGTSYINGQVSFSARGY